MNKLINRLKEMFINDKHKHDDIINHILLILFQNKTTEESLECFKELKNRFDKEIAKRGINSLIEHTACEDYFDKYKTEN